MCIRDRYRNYDSSRCRVYSVNDNLQQILRQLERWRVREGMRNLKSYPSTAYVACSRPALGTRTVSSTCTCKQSHLVGPCRPISALKKNSTYHARIAPKQIQILTRYRLKLLQLICKLILASLQNVNNYMLHDEFRRLPKKPRRYRPSTWRHFLPHNVASF